MTSEQTRARGGLQAALGAGDDPLSAARRLLPLHSRWAEGAQIPEDVRPVVARSWARAGARANDIHPIDAGELRARRVEDRELSGLLPLLKERLLPLATQAGNQLVISDAQGYVLWVLGPSMVRRRSDGIGFVTGARWRETDVGTNGIGAAMAERTPVQIFGPEHAREEQHSWVCTSAPLQNPATGKLVGAITLAGSFRTAHPHTLALATSVAAEAQGELLREHERNMHRLHSATGLPDGDFVLIDEHGAVAASRGYNTSSRLVVPTSLNEGLLWVPGLGAMVTRRVQGGWLLIASEVQTVLELSALPYPQARIRTGDRCTQIMLSPRHWQILELLAAHPHGVASAMVQDLWEGGASPVTVRAEISRLRGKLGGLIASRPYRLLVPVAVEG